MSNNIHSTAIIHPTAQIGSGVTIGAYSIIGENVIIGNNNNISSHVVIEKDTTIGNDNTLASSVILGGDPQDLGYRGEKSYLKIGDGNLFREFATIHRGSREGNTTVVGNNNMFMAYSHIGHDCVVHNRVVCTNYTGVSGHCVLEDGAIIGGIVGIHQFVRVGKMSMIGGLSKVNVDIPPFTLCDGNPIRVRTVNSIGLRRNGVSKEAIDALSEAVRLLYHSQLNRTSAIRQIKELAMYPDLEYLISFVEAIREGKSGRQEQSH